MRASRHPVRTIPLVIALAAAAAVAHAAESSVALSIGGCQHGGRWYRAGAAVPGVGDACLRCACAGGALACSRRACAPLPVPPPPRCHVRHRKNHCCPELHCPDSVTTMERGASARLDSDDLFAAAAPAPHALLHACVEDGVIFQSGSALHSGVACEQCFCLRGARRCVRPRCLPPPPGCRAQPAAGACCPQRYHCDHPPAHAPSHAAESHLHTNNTRDCYVDGAWVAEGERVPGAEARRPCSTCFCLRGAAHCRPLACARPLLGCAPQLRVGECCPHKYSCPHGSSQWESEVDSPNDILHNSLADFVGGEDRSIYGKTSNEEFSYDSTTSPATRHAAPTDPAPPTDPALPEAVTTSKVKRKTSDAPPTAASLKQLDRFAKLSEATTTDDFTFSSTEIYSTTETGTESERTSMDEFKSYVKTVVNGTINCTTEFASSQPLNLSLEELARVAAQSMSRTPPAAAAAAERADSDVITAAQLDDNDIFTINVTSSLHANPAPPPPPRARPGPDHDSHNDSKKIKEDYDYDYAEPTLPPSLPNLKIIPFVAADAVVDDEPLPHETPTYQILEREDKFPVYYPKVEKEPPFATRREDVYEPQYPMYAPENTKGSEDEVPSVSYAGLPGAGALAASLHQYAVGSSLADLDTSNTKKPVLHNSKDPPSVNLFSPPVETEGGFVPKGPGIINEYYAVHPSTPASPHIPHLTTSMQLDTDKDECISSDGRRVPEGETISIACSECACAWGELHCSPRACAPAPPGCRRRAPAPPAAAVSTAALGPDQCCGEIVCPKANKTTTTTSTTTTTTTTTTTSKPPTTPQRAPSSTGINKIKNYEATKTAAPTSPAHPATTTGFFKVKTDSLINSIQKGINYTTVADADEIWTQKAPTPVQQNKVITTSTPSAPAAVGTTTEEPSQEEVDDSQQGSQEYEDEEEEEDEGFSFGSVLKLLLSDSYDSSPPAPPRRPPAPSAPPPDIAVEQLTTSTSASTTTSTTMLTDKPPPTTTQPPTTTTIRTSSTSYKTPTSTTVRLSSTSYRPATTRRAVTRPAISSFVPMPPQHQLYAPPKGFLPPTSVNRIDHLVLGEATAIKRTTSRPVPVPTFRPSPLRPSISRPASTTRRPVTTQVPKLPAPAPAAATAAVAAGGVGGAGLLKLAGCNIYGRMYSVGLVVAELAAPCRECRCTELGVQCRDLPC